MEFLRILSMLFWPGLSHGRRKRVHIHGVWVAARAAPTDRTGEEASKSSCSTNVEPFHILHIFPQILFTKFHQCSPFFIIFIICFSNLSQISEISEMHWCTDEVALPAFPALIRAMAARMAALATAMAAMAMAFEVATPRNPLSPEEISEMLKGTDRHWKALTKALTGKVWSKFFCSCFDRFWLLKGGQAKWLTQASLSKLLNKS